MFDSVLQYLLQHLPAVPEELWHVLREMSPYLLVGFLVAGLLSVFLSPETVERHLGGRGLWPVVKAAILGVPLPLCSCGVIPVAASLRKHGASRGATVAFLISTPQTGAENIAVLYSLLGGVFAVFSPIAVLISGLAGGALVDLAEGGTLANGAAGEVSGAACRDECCSADNARKGRLRRVLEFGFITLPRDLIKPLAIGVAVAALIAALVPEGFFTTAFGGIFAGGVLGILLMMAMGIPVYVCATASIPMAWALMGKGVSPGAAFAFLLTGPASNAATIAMVWKTMGRRTALIYLGTLAASAMGGGLLLDAIFERSAFHLSTAAPQGEPAGPIWMAFEIACVAALVGVLVVSVVKGGKANEALRH